MINYAWLLCGLLLLWAPTSHAQVVSSPHSSFGGRDFSYFSVKISPEEAGRFSIVENSAGLKHQEFVDAQQNGVPFFLINASITDQACRSVGWLLANGTELSPVNTATGTGNFYLKPNGALVITGSDISVVETSAISTQTGVMIGAQSGPLLVESGIINAAFNPGSTNRYVRCGVGISTMGSERYVTFVISNEPVSFYELAAFLRDKLKCTVALCLESAGCDMYFPDRDVPYNAGGTTICRYLKYTVD